MNQKIVTNLLLGGLTIAAGYFGVELHKSTKANKTKVDEVIADLANKASIDVEEDIIEAAANRAADKACSEAVKLVNNQIKAKVEKAFGDALEAEKKDITTKLHEKFDSNINFDTLVNNVEKEVAHKVYKDMINKVEKYNNSIISRSVSELYRF